MKRDSMSPAFDPRIADWLEEDPDRAPAAVLETVVAAFPSIPQRRAVRVPWRFQTMKLLGAAVAIAIAVAIGGALIVARPWAANTGGPAPIAPTSPSPIPTAGPTAEPTAVSRIANLTRTFTSPLYRYSILLDPTWTVTPATTARTDPLSEETFSDVVDVTGTDTSFAGSASPLGDRTWDDLLARLHELATGNMPSGCDGGEVSNWPSIDVGGQEGRVQQFCNAAAVYALAGTTVYEFDWGNGSADPGSHLSEADFFEVLKGVTFPSEGPAGPAPSSP
jgi:hypothetical protein